MNIKIAEVTEQDKEVLAGIRIVSMRESLEAINRFDADRARLRFIEAFEVQNTRSISIDGQGVWSGVPNYGNHQSKSPGKWIACQAWRFTWESFECFLPESWI